MAIKQTFYYRQKTHEGKIYVDVFHTFEEACKYAKIAERDFVMQYDPTQDLDNIIVTSVPRSKTHYKSVIEVPCGAEYFSPERDPFCYIEIKPITFIG